MTDVEANELEAARQCALGLLARREHSAKELRHKLSLRGYADAVIQNVVDECMAKAWLDDGRFAEIYARSRLAKGYGPLKIDQELAQRGVEKPNWPELLAELATDWPTCLRNVYQRKYGSAPPDGRADYARCVRFLVQRGFPLTLIQTVLSEITHSANGKD
ncbi:MAG: regulatory protein RecX [Methylococcales bacterium]|nr:regulatory protein RecX [Methylococcales bacterium]